MTIPENAMITLISSDGKKVQLPLKAAKYSGLIQLTLLENLEDDDDDNDNYNDDNNTNDDDNNNNKKNHDQNDETITTNNNNNNNNNNIDDTKNDENNNNNNTNHRNNNDDDWDDKLTMELLRVDETTLIKVVEFLIHYEQNPFPSMPERLPANNFEGNITGEFYTQYMKQLEGNGKQDMDIFYNVKAAANYMDIAPLLEMICLWLTFKIAQLKKADAIAEFLRLPKMTEEEEQKAREEHPWMFDCEETNE